MVKTHLIGKFSFFYYDGWVDAFYCSRYVGGFASNKSDFRKDCRFAYRHRGLIPGAK